MSRRRFGNEWDATRARDLRTLPGFRPLERPGSFGTHAERTRKGGPEAPTLDHGPLDVGEWREEINGDFLAVPDQSVSPFFTRLATLRKEWPWIGFAIDTGEVPAGHTVTAGLFVETRSGPVVLLANVVGGAPAPVPQIQVVTPTAPIAFVGMTGIYVGARVSVFVRQSNGDHPEEVQMRANLWGYSAPTPDWVQ